MPTNEIKCGIKYGHTYHYIKATAGPGGSINTPERVKVRAGESAGFTFTPDKGYQIDDVLVNGKSIGAKNYYAFTNVCSDQSIHAAFKKVGHKNLQTGVAFEDVDENDWYYDLACPQHIDHSAS